MMDPTLTFGLGFGACALSMALFELGAQLINRIRARRIIQRLNEANKAAAYAELPAPWPMRDHELAARPDWVSKINARHSSPVTDREQRDHV